MNTIDFEKTEIFVNKAKEARATMPPPPPPVFGASPAPPPAAKATVKKLSKEEKILLATGGVLTLGLGAIVIASMNTEAQPEAVVQAESAVPHPQLEAPTIEVEGSQQPVEAVVQAPIQPIARPHSLPEVPHRRPAVNESHALVEVPENPTVATSVSDEMSFEEAFKAARAEVGPGGLFVWNDTYYGTFSENEWEALSDAKKEQWVAAAEPIIDPQTPEPPTPDSHVVVADRGEITWTGIDKNGDGNVDVLTARIHGQPPIVMIDTDGDGKLDTRYSLNAETGQMQVNAMEQNVWTMKEIGEIPSIEDGSTFLTAGLNDSKNAEAGRVSILEENGKYIIGVDLDNDTLVDVISVNKDGEQPFVAIDMDNDGQVETSFLYHADGQVMVANVLEPMESIRLQEPEELYESVADLEETDGADTSSHDHHKNQEDTPDEQAHAYNDADDDEFIG